jgi:drug/metabolite transporter (DMT)-like permease
MSTLSPAARGPVLMVLASALFAAMGLLVKVAAEGATPAQTVFARNLVALAVVLPLAVHRGARIRGVNRRALVLRALLGVTSMACYFTAISRLRLGDAVLITYTNPLFVALYSPWALGEAPRKGLWSALLVGLLGVGLVADPRFAGDGWGLVAAWATAALAAGAYVQVRIATRTDDGMTIVLWFSAIATALAAPSLWFGLPEPRVWAALAGVGALGLAAQLLMTAAYAATEAAAVSLYTYATPVFAYLLGAAALGEPLTWRGMAGTALVAVAGVLAARPPPQAPETDGADYSQSAPER